MWRIGVQEEKGKRKTKKKVPEKNEKPKPNRLRMIAPPPGISSEAKSRRGSILAAEHLLMRRGSRGSKQFNPAEFASFAMRDNVAAGAIPLDHLRKDGKRRRSSVNHRLSKVQEIHDRVNKAMNEYETNTNDDETTDEAYLLKEIDEHLYGIEDDMLRINVGMLMDKFRKVSQQVKENLYMVHKVNEDAEKKTELLESLQNWMDEDHFDNLETEENDDNIPEDAEAVTGYLDHVQNNLKKISLLNKKLANLRNSGQETIYLEREICNLERQVKQDSLDSAYERRHSKDVKDTKKQEFTYLKNAATEIYDMLNRTRMEGMANAHQFEEQLEKILKQSEEKDKDIEYLEGRLQQKKKLVRRWLCDYENLQNDHMLTKDEVISLKKTQRRLSLELENIKKKNNSAALLKQQQFNVNDNKDKELLKETEQHVHSLKQKNELLHWTVKEKEGIIEEQSRNIHQLKTALRKGHSSHNFHGNDKSGSPDKELPKSQSGKRDHDRQDQISRQTTRDGVSHTRVPSSVPPPTPSVHCISTELESLKIRVKTLERENSLLKKKETESKKEDEHNKDTITSTSSTSPKIITPKSTKQQHSNNQTITSSVEVQTDPISIAPAISPQPTVIIDPEEDTIEMISTAMQTSPPPTLQFLNVEERRRVYKLGQQMLLQFGSEWPAVAETFRKLHADDISEIDHGLACEDDFIRMFSGSPTKGRPMSDASARTAKENEEIEKARDDIIACRVSTSVQKLAEGMLSGLNPQILEERSFDFINLLRVELEDIQNKITSFVNKAQAMIGCQAGMINEANEAIKRSLPSGMQKKLDMIKSKQTKSLRQNASCSEHSQEWKDMSVTEQIRCQIKLIEENMRGTISETMNVFINELAKQHAEYNDIHTSVEGEVNINVGKLVPSPQTAITDIQNKVESSVRQMARVTRAERGVNNNSQLGRHEASTHAMGEGNMIITSSPDRRRVGVRKSLRTYNTFNTERPTPQLSLMGHAPEGGAMLQKTTARKPAYARTPQNRQVASDGMRSFARQPTRDLHLLRLRRTKVKSDMAKTRGLGMVIKNVPGQKEISPSISGPYKDKKRILTPLAPLITSTGPKMTSYSQPRPATQPTSVAKESFGLTFSDIQNQITEQVVPPKLRRPMLLIDRTLAIPTEAGSPNDLNLVISNLGSMAPAPTTNTLPLFSSKDLRLPKIA